MSTRNWLKMSSLVVILAGFVYAFAAFPPTAGLAAVVTDLTFWPLDGAQTLTGSEARLLSGVLGAVLAGWGVMLFLIADRLYPRDAGLARLAILAGVGTWFVMDTLASVAAGAPLNLVVNVVFAALFAIPLLRAAPFR